MKALYDVTAPAKLNLFLHITGRRADGYHLLQSAFMLIDWCDSLNFELRADGQISREDLTAPLPADDLCVRAAKALQSAGQTELGAHIGLEKHIPTQAGMGGGSSDAASVLLALNCLWGLKLPLAKLAEIGLTLGADVPFFLQCHNAWVEGVGEKIARIDLPDATFVVVKPDHGLETARIFSSPLLKRDTETAIISGFAAKPYEFGRNDLQTVARTLCPGVNQALGYLQNMGLKGRMTGSGSAVFAKVDTDENSVFSLSNWGIPAGLQARACRNLQIHPLAGWAFDVV
jgi:4-diphosphocytidyl-2-C-methyl-D-erythritol kinase